MRGKKDLLRWSAAVAVLALALVGCGKKDDTAAKGEKAEPTGEKVEKAEGAQEAEKAAEAAGDEAQEAAEKGAEAAEEGAEAAAEAAGEAAAEGEKAAEAAAEEAGEAAAEVEAAVEGAGDAAKEAAEEAGAAAAEVAEGAKAAAGGVEAFLKDESAPLTDAIYETLLLNLKDCEVQEFGIDHKCEAYKNFRAARGRKTALKDLAGWSKDLGKKHIAHESPAVRLQAAQLMSSVFGSSEDTQQVVAKAAREEKDPAVLRAMLRTVGSRHAKNEELKKLFLEMADHEEEKVRIEVLGWFLSSFGKDVPETFEKAMEKLDGDPSMKVREYACSKLYGSSNPKALEAFEKYLTAEDTPDELFGGCFRGVVDSWTGFPKPEDPSKKGYELTLQVLKATPRTEKRPPWAGISTLRAAKEEAKTSFDKEWLEKVKDWYKKEDLVASLAELAKDRAANWMARTGAIDVIVELGGAKDIVQGIRDSYKDVEGKFGSDSHVIRKADKALEKMGS